MVERRLAPLPCGLSAKQADGWFKLGESNYVFLLFFTEMVLFLDYLMHLLPKFLNDFKEMKNYMENRA